VSARRPNLLVHLRGPEPKPDPRAASLPTATIRGNRAALAALRDAIDHALRSEEGNTIRVFKEADGSEYSLSVWVARSKEEMGEPAKLGLGGPQ
jgi:hypothetical protein